jgi:pimeloyl-ACP methyl ester carboxylesterase
MATAVLVHGARSSPADWRWVAANLEARGLDPVMPDLPSHRHSWSGGPEDVLEVAAAIRQASPPVVVVGWSYGGAVIGDITDTGAIARLLYVGSFPEPVPTEQGNPPELEGVPHMLFPDEATIVLDDDWWLASDEVAALPIEVVDHLREHRRRPMTRSALSAPPVAEPWRTVPTPILIGRSDSFPPADFQQWIDAQFSDVRIVDGDHFLPLLQPDLVAEVIAESFASDL